MFIYGCVTKTPCRTLLFDKLTQFGTGGYDAFGIAINTKEGFDCAKGAKSMNALKEILPQSESGCGLIHARWATCGERTDENAHPFISSQVCAASNGTIENAAALRSKLALMPYPDSDGAVLPHLFTPYLQDGMPMLHAIRQIYAEMQGEFAMVAMQKGKNSLYAVNHGAPLYAAISAAGTYLSSDLSAFDADAQKIYTIAPGETAQLFVDKINFYNQKLKKIKKQPCSMAVRSGAPPRPHRLIEDIQAVPSVIENLTRQYTNGEETRFPKLKIKLSRLQRIYLVGCGTSYNLARAGACNFEAICDIPVFAFSSGEYCCSNAVCDRNTLLIALSASGETAETLCAVKAAQKYDAKIIAVTADPNSRLARTCKTILPIPRTSPDPLSACEMFDCGYILLCLLAVHLGMKQKTITPLFARMAVKMTSALPDKIRLILKSEKELRTLSNELAAYQNLVIIGQNVDYAAACEGALQFSQTTGRFAAAVPAGELRHTLLPILNRSTAVLAFVSGKELSEKTCAALTQAKIRGAAAIVCTGENLVPYITDQALIFAFPDSIPLLSPVCHEITLQLLSAQLQQSPGENQTEQPAATLRYFAI